jgi:23S rRNA pseudouridine955/2504/2580 synthase
MKKGKLLEVIYEDENYLILNKPWGIASLDEQVFSTPSMLRLLRAQFPEAQLCHRLDKETSGCLLASKHPEAYRHAAILFEHKKIEKTYTAIACGAHNFHNKEVNLPLLIANKRVRVNKQKGKPALTYFTTVENFKHFTVISCKPITGRLHQIRVHLYSINAPIVNDVLYSGSRPYLSQIKRGFKLSKNEEEEEPIISRIALHASQLEFESIDGKIIKAEAPLNKELEALLKILRRYD